MKIDQWAAWNGIPPATVAELRTMLLDVPYSAVVGTDETAAQSAVRVAASQAGWRLWRNNVGAGKLDTGSFLRWGLANDSAAMNQTIKSGDLVGIRPVVITADMVGQTIGQFVSREVKRPGWRYTGTEREIAQLKWIELVVSLGGDACFTTGGLT